MTSLVWFLTEQGKHYLSDQLFEYTKQQGGQSIKTEEVVLEPQKVGEDVQIAPAKPKTLKDFLNYGKETR